MISILTHLKHKHKAITRGAPRAPCQELQPSFWARDSNWQPSGSWTTHVISGVSTTQVAHLKTQKPDLLVLFQSMFVSDFMVMTEVIQRSILTFVPNQIFPRRDCGSWMVRQKLKVQKYRGTKTEVGKVMGPDQMTCEEHMLSSVSRTEQSEQIDSKTLNSPCCDQ